MPSAPVTPAATARGGYDRPPSNAQNATTMPVDPTKHDAMRRPIAALWSTPDDYRVGGHSEHWPSQPSWPLSRASGPTGVVGGARRSEERRVGKECGWGWWW